MLPFYTLWPLAPFGQHPDTDISILYFVCKLAVFRYFAILVPYFLCKFAAVVSFGGLGTFKCTHLEKKYIHIHTSKPLKPSSQHPDTDIWILYLLCKLAVFLYITLLFLYFLCKLAAVLCFGDIGTFKPISRHRYLNSLLFYVNSQFFYTLL